MARRHLLSLRQKRDNMASGLPEWEELREHASQIKQHTVTHLADYLEEFSTQLESRGVIVHWAKDANDFNNIVLDILQSHGVKKMVKSKSMLTEECAMNPFLENHGIDVVETDLGERILQLLHQKPSHIVMPAIHLKREEVGQMFEEKGISTEKGNYDPTYLTQCARKHLRNQFMEAGAGMTGCNFGVARPAISWFAPTRATRHVNINAKATSRGNGNREDCARLQVARRIPATALPLCYRTAHNGIHLTLPSGKTGSGDARHPRGQRTKRHPCQRRALGNAEVHSLRSLHEHLPRIPPLGWLLIHLLHPRTYRHQPWYAARCVTLQRQRQRLHALPLMPTTYARLR